MRLARIFCSALIFFCAVVAADEFEQLRSAVARGDYSAAVPALQAAAARDDARAMNLLAWLYQQGQGFPHDAAKALSLYTRAAELGDAEAQFNLGNMYRLGEGVPADEAWALTYYRQAAAQGHTGAAHNLDELYRTAGISPVRPRLDQAARSQTPPVAVPRPTPKSGPLAMNTEPAAITSNLPSRVNSGPSDDELRAIELARAAGIAVVLDENAASPTVPVVNVPRPAALNASSDGMPAFTPSSAASDPDTVENNEEGTAAYQSAQRYLRGQGVARDQATGLQWLQRAARAGHLEAKYELALRYLNGQGLNADEAMAITLLRDAAQAGHPLAQAKIRQVYAAAGLPMPELMRPQAPLAPTSASDKNAPMAPSGAAQTWSTQPVASTSPITKTIPKTNSFPLPTLTERQANAAVTAAATQSEIQLAAHTGEHHATRGAAAGMMADAAAEEEPDLVDFETERDDTKPAPVTDGAVAGQSVAAGSTRDLTQSPGTSASPQTVIDDDNATRSPAATLADARAALDAHEFTRAASIFTTLAERGDAEAQAHIGYMTYQGEGVPGDKAKAVQWYRKAALQGNRDAQYNLAVALAFGDGVARNDTAALQWYRRAAEQGSAVAQYSLGLSYALGDGAVQSDKDALKWYGAAAEQGYADAQYNLGEMLHAGRGASGREHDALHWFMEAARNGNASAQNRLGNIYRDGSGVERNVNEAMHWYQLAAAQGHREAQAGLAALQARQ